MPKSPVPGLLARRAVLAGTVASAALQAGSSWAAGARADPPDSLGNEAVPLSDTDLLAALVRLRGSLDGRVTAGWLESWRYAVIDGEAWPLCRVLAGALSRFERKRDDLYEATILEITHYLDFATGELLDTLTMPVTGRVVKVPPYRIGPTPVRFAVRLDERETFSPTQEGKGAGNFAPLGEVRLRRSVSDARRSGDRLFLRHEEHGSLTPASAGVPPVSYREWTLWSGPAAVALDPAAGYCPSEYSYTAMTSWRPWMQMDGVRGHTLDSGRGAKARRLGDLPQRYLELTERLHPDVIRDPVAALARRAG
jgi:hypothetical protein